MKRLLRIWLISVLFAAFLASNTSLAQDLPEWALGPFARLTNVGPIIQPNPKSVFKCPMRKTLVHWQALHTFNPAVAVMNGRLYMLYRAEDDTGSGLGGHTSRLGIAWSNDGVQFCRKDTPVFFPAVDLQKAYEWDGGCEDPRIVCTTDGTYVLTYTQWNHKTPRLAVATSRDLVHWTKHGPAFAKALGGRYLNMGSKSGSIVTTLRNGKLVATKIKNKYWMYWGDVGIFLAYSSNLKDWTVVENEQCKPLVVLGMRSGYFDSGIAEPGPAAILTRHGILVLYNGKNSDSDDDRDSDHSIGKGAYCAGQALFLASDPKILRYRLDKPYLRPEKDFEKTGQYTAGTVFTEGLAFFRGEWFLYYGCADSYVGLAVYSPVCQPKRLTENTKAHTHLATAGVR